MTRKHYTELAQIIRDNLVEFNSQKGEIIFKEYFKTELLSFLKRDNRAFKKDLFIEASGLELDILSMAKHPEHISNHLEKALEHATGSEIGKFGYKA